MKRFFYICVVMLMVGLPAFGATYQEAVKVDANGQTMDLESSGNSNKAVIFKHGVAVNATNLGITKEVHVALRTDSPPCTANLCGSGAPGNAYNVNGSTEAEKAARLSAVWAAAKGMTIIYDTDGIYRTLGYLFGDTNRDTATPGTKHIGRGIDKTTIKLYGASNSPADGRIFSRADSTSRSDGFVVQDMTLDGDATNQPTWTNAATDQNIEPVKITGDTRLERIKVTGAGVNKAGKECFFVILTPIGAAPSGDFSNSMFKDSQIIANVNSLGTLTGVLQLAIPLTDTGRNNKCVNVTIDMSGATAPTKQGFAVEEADHCYVKGATNGFYNEPAGGGRQRMWIHESTAASCTNFLLSHAHDWAESGADLWAPGDMTEGFLVENNRAVDCTAFAGIYGDGGYGVGAGTNIYYKQFEMHGNHFVKSDGSLDTSANLLCNILSVASVKIYDNEINSSYAYAINVASTTRSVFNNTKSDGSLTPYAIIYGPGQPQTILTGAIVSGSATISGTATAGNVSAVNLFGNASGVTNVQADSISGISHEIIDTNYTISNTDYLIYVKGPLTASRTFTLPSANANEGKFKHVVDISGQVETYPVTITPVDGSTFSLNTNKLWVDFVAHNGVWYAVAPRSRAKVYRALVTQSSTSAPVATVLENTMGGTVVWARGSSGVYTATLTGAFTASKTFAQASGNTVPAFLPVYRASADVMNLSSFDNTNTAADNLMTAATVEILVYP